MDEYKEHLRMLVRNAEERYIWYKKELQNWYQKGWAKEIPDWMKHLKEMEKIEEKDLKRYREELEYYNQGLNPPFCYH